MPKNDLQKILDTEGIRLKELELASGVSTRTLSDVAKGKRSGAPATIGKIIKGLNKLSQNKYNQEDIFQKKPKK